ncbi:unnamed protein product (macronuclear) [Paramecium tetraurelia]|uniref:Uncharacterized protein n=1 Tax=Paramecium tetraurelia TaxID=5888 RepID=A0BCS3_PARTE|nr:uncharacterized protein GSPATT00004434001 [Paramecium tetraurelia]CAK56340.1 unnamed protein product [Paramecium tetraurelia]|eukprot:XP_001423738.1 hypothetical protein (macronuclear) [Paramecium tetraurelia strain d4-2]
MQFTSSKESQYLFTLYEMCRRNVINQAQKGELKDLLIQGDRKTQEILQIYQKNANKQELEKGILDLLGKLSQDIIQINLMDLIQFTAFLLNTNLEDRNLCKLNRLKKIGINQTYLRACKSQDSLNQKPIMKEDLNKLTRAIKERYSFNHLEIQYRSKNQGKRLSDNFYIESVKTGL